MVGHIFAFHGSNDSRWHPTTLIPTLTHAKVIYQKRRSFAYLGSANANSASRDTGVCVPSSQEPHVKSSRSGSGRRCREWTSLVAVAWLSAWRRQESIDLLASSLGSFSAINTKIPSEANAFSSNLIRV